MLGNIVAGAGLRGMQTTAQDLERMLMGYKAIDRLSERSRNEQESDGEDGDGGVGVVNGRVNGVRQGAIGEEDDEDSDFDM